LALPPGGSRRHWRNRNIRGRECQRRPEEWADNEKEKKGKGGKKKGNSGGGCTVRHSEGQILDFIAKAAKQYGQSENDMVRVARCESVLNPCAVNSSGPYYGLFQYLKSTWKATPYGDRDIFDPEAQSLATGWM
jgi:hypothetical protein